MYMYMCFCVHLYIQLHNTLVSGVMPLSDSSVCSSPPILPPSHPSLISPSPPLLPSASPPLSPSPHAHTHSSDFPSIRNLFLYYEDKGTLLVIPVVATVYMGLLFLFFTTNFFLASFVDPGIYPRGILYIHIHVCIICPMLQSYYV